jgi:hypothetical protein
LVATATKHFSVEPHEELDLFGAAPPVLGRKRIHRQVFDSDLDCPSNDIEQSGLTRPVTFNPRKTSRVRPSTIAIHDDCDVFGNEVALNDGRREPRVI